MKILLVTDKPKSSGFAVRDMFFVAGVKHDLQEASALEAVSNFDSLSPDFIVVESLDNPDFSKNVVKQTSMLAGKTPIFVLHHGEMHDAALNASIESEFRDLGADGFADTQSNFDQVASRLLQTAGVRPPQQLRHINKRSVLVGDIRFDLIAKKVYSFKDEGGDEYDQDDDFVSFAHTSQRMLFNARSQGRSAKQSTDANKLFDLDDQEVALLNTLALRQGEYIPRKDIIRFMQADQRIVPEIETLDSIVTGLITKLSDHRENYGDFVLHRNNRYCLNDIDMPLVGMKIDLPDPESDAPDLRAVLAEEYGDRSMSGISYAVYPPSQNKLSIGPHLRVNTNTAKAYVFRNANNSVALDEQEIAIIEFIAHADENVTSMRNIISDIYVGPEKPSTRYLRGLIGSVNQKIVSLGFQDDLIKTVKGRGFGLNPDFISQDSHAPVPRHKN